MCHKLSWADGHPTRRCRLQRGKRQDSTETAFHEEELAVSQPQRQTQREKGCQHRVKNQGVTLLGGFGGIKKTQNC